MAHTIKNTSDTELEIIVSLSVEEVEEHKKDALKTLGKDVSVPGFRKGSVPEKKLVEMIGEGHLWREMAERAVAATYPEIVKEEKLRVIGRPSVTLTKMAPGNPLEFTITTAMMPDFTMPDYKAIAAKTNKKKADIAVTDKDLEEALENIRKQFGQMERMAEAQKTGKELTPEEIQAEPEAVELTDELVQKLGEFKDVADFTEKLREQLAKEKEVKARDAKRMDIVAAITDKAKLSLPAIVVDAELGKMEAQFRADVERSGIQYDDYVKQVGKTPEEMRDGWRADAEKNAKMQVILNEIAQAEDLKADEKELAEHVKNMLEQQKQMDKDFEITKEAEMNASIYIESMMRNEKVFEFLEQQTA